MTRQSALPLSGHQRPYRGATDEWYTPPELFAALALDFDLDPASPLDGPVPWVPARRFLTARENGLSAPWDPHELVWLNPPYGPEVGNWIGRLARHGRGVALLFARTDTRWFHDWIPHADVVCFLAGRIHFYRRDGTRAHFNAGAPSMLVAYGDDAAEAVRRAGLGMVLEVPA